MAAPAGARSLVLGWGMSTPEQLEPYLALHRDLGVEPTLHIASVAEGLLRPRAYVRRLRRALAPLLAEPPYAFYIHLFSDNGFIALAQTLDELASSAAGRAALGALRGVVFDSSPGLHTAQTASVFADRFAQGTTPFVARRLGLGARRDRVFGVTRALRALFLGYHRLFPAGVRRALSARSRVEAHGLRVPMLFVCGGADTLVSADGVEQYAASWAARGVSTRVVSFEGGRHVALLGADRARYERELAAFVGASA